MPDDPIFVALRKGRSLTPAVALLAVRYRQARIDDLWAEIRVLEALIKQQSGHHPILAERDRALETA